MRFLSLAAGLSVGGLALGLIAVPASAAMLKFKADLSAEQEVPPHPGLKGTGMVEASLDTAAMTMTYHVTYDGLTGTAMAAHFHGPAAVGKNAGVQVPVAGALSSGMDGTATLTAAQAKMLEDGAMYFNIHTAANQGGEIRGQLVKQ